jgi:histidinol-phosphatase (PHP family)
MIDIHIHAQFSFDSSELAENYIERAKQLNIPVIGFSEHYDYDAVLDGADIKLADIPAYINNVQRLKGMYSSPQILSGIEFGYSKAAASRYKQIESSYPFDYIINSVHTVSGRGDSYYPEFFRGSSIRQAYLEYFNAVLQSIKVDYDYQIIGHIGYVSRYAKGENTKIKLCDYSEIYDEILKEIIARDKCLEINTSSGDAGSDFLPDKDVIERYLALGGKKLSFASDAHRADDYLRKVIIVKDYLTSIGVSKLCYYKNRNCVFYDIK